MIYVKNVCFIKLAGNENGSFRDLRDGELRSRLVVAGIETARGLDWGIAVEKLATILGLND